MGKKSKQKYTTCFSEQEGVQLKKKFTIHDLKQITPLTYNQEIAFRNWMSSESSNLCMIGSAGTGKTLIGAFLAMQNILSEKYPQDKMIIIRSAVASRNIGFLPGTEEEKLAVFEEPYQYIFDQLFGWKDSYNNLKQIGKLYFRPTSFLRGITFDNAIVLIDEIQNMTFHEIDTILTRIGLDTRLIVCGDIYQTDLITKKTDQSGFREIINVIKAMPDHFDIVEFQPEDIVRSGFVKAYIRTKHDIMGI